jgi:putative Holliday junction resolvase
MKYLGIDYGTKRIGVAISDENGEYAFPKTILDRHQALQEIVLLCTQESIGAIVIGYSVASNGIENEVTQKAAQFKEKVAEATHLPVHFEREDYSSVEAHRYQIKAGNRDDSAAAIILQRYLDKQR